MSNNIALILAGHGSHISPNTAGIVWNYVDRLRQWGIADEVTACFWKEVPAFSHVLDTIQSETVVIVPVFTAQGYFTQTVIPAEMSLEGNITHKHGKIIYLTPTIGEHSYLETIVQQRVTDTLHHHQLPHDNTVVAIIGHGTRRNSRSQDATRHQAEHIRQQQLVSQVVDVYLDDAPDIPSLYQTTDADNIIAVPFFLAEGSHVTIDVPDALGITYGNVPDTVNGRHVYYTPPVGTDDAMCRVILELARDTGLPFERQPIDTVWDGFPSAGRETFVQTLNNHQPLLFGQVMVSDKKVWHTASPQDTSEQLASPEALRGFVRDNPFRPLPTSTDLPSGWSVDVASAQEAYAVVETIYPTLITDWANQQNNTFLTESLEDIGTRQTGMFENVHQLDDIIIQNTVESVCNRCIRQPSWLTGQSSDTTSLPCKTPCNVWLSTAKKMGDTQHEHRKSLSDRGGSR